MSALRQLVRTSGRRARRQAEAMTMSDTTQAQGHEAAIREIVRRCPLDRDAQRGGWDWMLTDDDVRAILDHAEELEQAARAARQYADWLEPWAASTQALTARHMAQERARLGVDAGEGAAS